MEALERAGVKNGWIRKRVSGRFDKYYQSKTESRHGLIRAFIISIAKTKKHFTVDDFMPPLTRQQAYSALQQMVRHGIAEVAEPGKAGPRAIRTLFILIDKKTALGNMFARLKHKKKYERRKTTN